MRAPATPAPSLAAPHLLSGLELNKGVRSLALSGCHNSERADGAEGREEAQDFAIAVASREAPHIQVAVGRQRPLAGACHCQTRQARHQAGRCSGDRGEGRMCRCQGTKHFCMSQRAEHDVSICITMLLAFQEPPLGRSEIRLR